MSDHGVHELKLADYTAGNLAEDDAEDFEMHLLGCASCQTEVEKEQRLQMALQQNPASTRAMLSRRASSESSLRAAGSWLAALVQSMRLRPAHAYAFTIGIVAGAALLATFSQRFTPIPASEVPFLGATLQPDLERFVSVDEQQLTLAGIQGTLRSLRAGEQLLVEAELHSEQPIEFVVAFDDGAFTPVGVQQQGPVTSRLQLRAGQMRIEHRGDNRYVLLLHDGVNDATPLRVTIQSGDARLEKVLQTGTR